jgi:diaminohydroxyphosphoribosylaminopyrimidine deaminase/5-amino-6-(5-phosphoribosylamino)uracil reductase
MHSEQSLTAQAAMRLAIVCAREVEGRTAPRPPVGAVVVRDGVVVGRGATSPPYGPHAEVHALRQAGALAQGADLYVTLEPCCVTIHTPPCTKAIIAAGIQRVFIGSLDPNPAVYQQGIAQLRESGIEVQQGLAEAETNDLIRPFATLVRHARPYVTAKWAMTLDGKLATRTGDAYWISRPEARQHVHNLRDRVDAILVGAGTMRADNPLLTVRLSLEQRSVQRQERSGPLRVVLAGLTDLPEDSQLLQPELASGTCLIVGEKHSQAQIQRLQARGIEVLVVAVNPQGLPDLRETLRILAQKGVMHLLIEGGSRLLGSAFDLGLIDHVAAFIAPKLIGGMTASSPIGGLGIASMSEAIQLQSVQTQTIGGDLLVEGEIAHV